MRAGVEVELLLSPPLPLPLLLPLTLALNLELRVSLSLLLLLLFSLSKVSDRAESRSAGETKRLYTKNSASLPSKKPFLVAAVEMTPISQARVFWTSEKDLEELATRVLLTYSRTPELLKQNKTRCQPLRLTEVLELRVTLLPSRLRNRARTLAVLSRNTLNWSPLRTVPLASLENKPFAEARLLVGLKRRDTQPSLSSYSER